MRAADAIFFAGGDQSRYVELIAGSSLETLLKEKGSRITIGGTSAGAAIEGAPRKPCACACRRPYAFAAVHREL